MSLQFAKYRATLEAVAFQVYEILISMEKDSGKALQRLKVDGGMTKNNLLMQIQADFNGKFLINWLTNSLWNVNKICQPLGIEVVRPDMAETTSLGAALAAAKTMGLWSLESNEDQSSTTSFSPSMSSEIRDAKYKRWGEAIQRSLNWAKIWLKLKKYWKYNFDILWILIFFPKSYLKHQYKNK